MANYAASILSPAVHSVKYVVAVIKRQVTYFYCFKRNIAALQDEAERLYDVVCEMRARVNAANDNLQEINPETVYWLRATDDLAEHATDILNEVANAENGCLDVKTRYFLSRRAVKTTEAMTRFRQQYRLVSDVNMASKPNIEFDSRKQIEQDIMTTLRDYKEKRTIGICGMGGIGKTTVAKRIMNTALDYGIFHEVVMVIISQQVDELRIQVDIGRSLGLADLEKDTPQTRVERIHQRIISGTRRILLVLDDVWESLNLNDLGIPCEGDSGKCVILMTSSNSDVLSEMGVEKIFRINQLPAEEAWIYFRQKVGPYIDDEQLVYIAKSIVNKCGGLPGALETIANALKGETIVSVWIDTLEILRNPSPKNVPSLIAGFYHPLLISYNKLDYDAKFVFLLCGLFPEDNDILPEYLTYFCMGLGFFESNLDEARHRTSALIKKLKSRSLLIDGEKEDCARMHDSVRNFCIFIAKQEGHIGSRDCTWMSCSQQTEMGLVFPNLKLLYLIHYSEEGEEIEMDDNFFEGMRDLNVLSIENYSWTSLPQTTQLLENIRTLLLVSCPDLEAISIVGDLVNLEVLICRGCGSIQELPPEIGRLRHLKLLELSDCRELQRIGRGVISSLVGLRELKMLGSFNQWEAEDTEERRNACLRELKSLTNLACLEIEIDDPTLAAEMKHLPLSLGNFEFRLSTDFHVRKRENIKMHLYWEGIFFLGHWIEMHLLRSDTEYLYLTGDGADKLDLSKLQKIERLELGGCDTMKNIGSILMDDDDDGRYGDTTMLLPIEHLKLFSLPKLEELWDSPISSYFKNLKHIILEDLWALKQLWKSSSLLHNYDVALFTNLSSIEIKGCHSLRNICQFSTTGMSSLLQLELLKIEECQILEQVIWWDDEENSRNKTLVFPKLTFLSLKSLPRFTSLCRGFEGFEFPQLDLIQVKDCPLLTTVDPINLFFEPDKVKMEVWKNQPLMSAEYLSLEGDDVKNLDFRVDQNMRCLTFKECLRGTKLVNATTMHTLFPQLEVLRLVKLTELEEIWNNEGPIPSHIFKNLKELRLEFLPALKHLCPSQTNVASIFSRLSSIYIYGCHGLRNLFLLSATAGGSYLAKLEELVIESCDMMEQVFLCNEEENENQSNRQIQKLKVLVLHSLPRLTSFCKGIEKFEFPLLKRKRISRCPLLQNFISTTDGSPDDDDSIHLFCKLDNKEKTKLKVQGNISVRNRIQECVDYVCLEGDGSTILDADQVGQSMRCLTFRECSMKRATIATVFPLLEVMWLVDITNLEEICDTDVPKNLKELRLKSLPALKHLKQISSTPTPTPTPSQINVVSIFSQLSCIYIYGCHGLCNIFSLSSGSCLLLLERLVIEGCGMMEQLFLWNEEERNIDITLAFPKLKFLRLISLPMLTSFCKGNQSLEFPLLARMSITRCPLLVLGNFVSSDESPDDHYNSMHSIRKPDKKKTERWINELYKNVTYLSVEEDVNRNLDLQQLLNMRQLRSKECSTGMKLVNMATIATFFPLLEVMQLVKLAEVEKMEFDGTMPSISLQNLRELRLQSLQALKHLWKSSSSPSQMIVASIFNQLSSIYIFGCNRLCNLFSLSMTAKGSCLLQLEKLEIESCEMMEQVFLWNEESEKPRSIHVGELPKLNFLRLSFLPGLTDFCSGIKRIECPLLTDVLIVNCPKLRSSVYLNGKHSAIFNSSKSVQHQRAKDTNSAMQLRRPGTEEKGKRRLEDSSNEIKEGY